MVGVDPGTRLALIERGPAKTKLTDGTMDFEVDNEDLTDDAEAARMARDADEQAQAVLAAWQQHWNAGMDQPLREPAGRGEISPRAQAALDAGPPVIAASRSAAGSPMQGSLLDRPAYNQHLSVPYWYRYGYWYRSDQWGYRYYVDAYGRWIYY